MAGASPCFLEARLRKAGEALADALGRVILLLPGAEAAAALGNETNADVEGAVEQFLDAYLQSPFSAGMPTGVRDHFPNQYINALKDAE